MSPIFVVVPVDVNLGWLNDGVAYEAQSPQDAVNQYVVSSGKGHLPVPDTFYQGDEPPKTTIGNFEVYGPI